MTVSADSVPKKPTSGKSFKKNLTDIEILEKLQIRILNKLRGEKFQPKVADFLKVIDFKLKLKCTGPEKQKIWDLIEQIRKEELEEYDDED